MIIYLHGFNSSPESFKANVVKHRLAELGRADEFLCPKLPWRFSDAAALIDNMLVSLAGKPVCLIGSSLGGFYATHFAEKYGLAAVMVNPAVKPYESLAKYQGPQRNLYTGEEYVLEPAHVDELLAIDVPKITRHQRYLLLTKTGDEVLDYRQGAQKFIGASQIVIEGGDHAFQDFGLYVDRVIVFADNHAAEGIMPSVHSNPRSP
ncbi:MAG TPA: YqiA/YcfP family alpha/beta fold hydrolase [Burkholderiales bacterium]|nr:YqiA/YcfP family alpha/beta fold hydrolase [Burkholderiales bacterium]